MPTPALLRPGGLEAIAELAVEFQLPSVSTAITPSRACPRCSCARSQPSCSALPLRPCQLPAPPAGPGGPREPPGLAQKSRRQRARGSAAAGVGAVPHSAVPAATTMGPPRCVELPAKGHYVLTNAHVPTGCIAGELPAGASVCVDNVAELDLEASRDGFCWSACAAAEKHSHSTPQPGMLGMLASAAICSVMGWHDGPSVACAAPPHLDRCFPTPAILCPA